MRRTKIPAPEEGEAKWVLTQEITLFVNTVFQRKLRPSRALYEAVFEAMENGYTADQVRIAFWVARCIDGSYWLKERLADDLSPEIVLRFKGGMNPQTGWEAKRWLEDLLQRIDETNPELVRRVLAQLPESSRKSHRELLDRMQMKVGSEKDEPGSHDGSF